MYLDIVDDRFENLVEVRPRGLAWSRYDGEEYRVSLLITKIARQVHYTRV